MEKYLVLFAVVSEVGDMVGHEQTLLRCCRCCDCESYPPPTCRCCGKRKPTRKEKKMSHAKKYTLPGVTIVTLDIRNICVIQKIYMYRRPKKSGRNRTTTDMIFFFSSQDCEPQFPECTQVTYKTYTIIICWPCLVWLCYLLGSTRIRFTLIYLPACSSNDADKLHTCIERAKAA